MVFPTAGEDQPRSPVYHADQQPPGMARSCDQSALCLQTTAEPNLAQIFPRQWKGLPLGAAELAPGSWLCHEQHINLQASYAAALSLSLPLAEPGSQGRAGSRGRSGAANIWDGGMAGA